MPPKKRVNQRLKIPRNPDKFWELCDGLQMGTEPESYFLKGLQGTQPESLSGLLDRLVMDHGSQYQAVTTEIDEHLREISFHSSVVKLKELLCGENSEFFNYVTMAAMMGQTSTVAKGDPESIAAENQLFNTVATTLDEVKRGIAAHNTELKAFKRRLTSEAGQMVIAEEEQENRAIAEYVRQSQAVISMFTDSVKVQSVEDILENMRNGQLIRDKETYLKETNAAIEHSEDIMAKLANARALLTGIHKRTLEMLGDKAVGGDIELE